MRWEITNNTPRVGDIRFRTRFAWFPTKVLSKITMTDHVVWLELYLEEQVYVPENGGWGYMEVWKTQKLKNS